MKYMIGILPPSPTPTFPGKGALFIPKMSLEAGTPQSFDASYAPACVVAFTK
jgi:hypothetical protein